MPRSKESRTEKRARRKKNRKDRVTARRQIMSLAASLYEEGDDVESLGEKLHDAAESIGDRPFMDLMLKLIEIMLPMLIRMLSGV